MASRDWLRHWTNVSEPVGGNLGDEWYISTSNVFTKRLAINGSTVGWHPLVYVNTLTQTATVPGNIETTGSVIISNVSIRTTATTNTSSQPIGTRNLVISGGIEARLYARPWHFINVPESFVNNVTLDLSSATSFCIQLGTSSNISLVASPNRTSPGQEVEFRVYIRQPFSGTVGQVNFSGLTTNWANQQTPTMSSANQLTDIYSFTILGGSAIFGIVVAQGIPGLPTGFIP